MEDDLFNIDIVRDFIALKGGKVRNHDLVTHFKTFLNDPRCKASNRQKFKVFVNTLATVKLDETGEKVLVLKKKYRDDNVAVASSSASAEPKEEKLSKLAAPKAKIRETFEVRKPSEDDSSESKEESLLDSIQKELVKSKISEIETPAPDYETQKHADVSSVFSSTDASDNTPTVDEPVPNYEDPVAEEPPADYDNSDTSETMHTAGVSNEVTNDVFLDSKDVPDQDQKESKRTEVIELGEGSEKVLKEQQEVVQNAPLLPTYEAGSETEKQEVVNKSESDDQKLNEPSGPGTLAGVPEEEVLKTPVRSSSSNGVATTPIEEPVSVKDRAKHLNKMSSQSELTNVPAPKKSQKKADSDGDSMNSMTISLDPAEREWIIASAKADYQHMAKLLHQQPHLAKRKDFVTGYTGLHWAAKHGNIEIVKLLCGAGAIVNARSTGGYTPLHLASMHGKEDIIEILVETYGADANIRDFSGKKPKQYLKNAASTRVQQLLQARRSSQSIGFKRTGSYSAKIGTTGHFGIKASTAMRTSWIDNRQSVSRSPSRSPKDKRKGHKSSEDLFLMPPPHDVPLRKKRSKRTPADSLGDTGRTMSDQFLADKIKFYTSSSNPEINKSESDPFLQMSEPDISKPVHQSASYSSFV